MFMLGYAKTTVESSNSKRISSGLQNLDTHLLGSHSLTSGSFKYGSKLSISPDNLIIESNGNYNAFTGRHMLTPYVGYEMQLSESIWGVKFEHEIGLGKRTYKDSTGAKFKDSGMEVTTLSSFYEHEVAPQWKWGFSLGWAHVADYVNDNGTFESMTPLHILSFYSNHPVGSGTFITKLEYTFTSDKELDGIKILSVPLYNLSLGYRFSL